MTEFVQDYWIALLVALVLAAVAIWWILAASRRTRVEFESDEEDGAPARRNQALIDAPPVAHIAPMRPVTKPVTPPPAITPDLAPDLAPDPAPGTSTSSESGDDLTRIKGVGPRLHQQLRELGVTGFAQIAAWDDAEIDRIDAQLGRFQGRIRRDDWRTQASLLADGDITGYEEKFGKL